jgi:hypothetical protein
MTATWLDLKRPLDPGLDQLLRDLDDQLQSRSILNLLFALQKSKELPSCHW